MRVKLHSKFFCVCLLVILLGSSFVAFTPLLKTNVNDETLESAIEKNGTDSFDSLFSPTQMADPLTEDIMYEKDTDLLLDEPLETNFPLDMFQRYGRYPIENEKYTTDYYGDYGSGLHIEYDVSGNHIFITMIVGSYDFVRYSFEEGTYDTIHISGAETAATHGAPALPYKNIMLNIPEGAIVLETEIIDIDEKEINDLDVIPGPEPLEISRTLFTDQVLWFDPIHYLSNDYTPENNVESTEVGIWGKPALHLTLNPLRYNPILDEGVLALRMQIVITFDRDVTLTDVLPPNEYPLEYDVGGNYVFVVDSAFTSSVGDFATWKTSLGWNVEIVTVQDIYSTYTGSDHAEELRNYIIDEYQTNGTLYYLLVGDCDVVPAREVWDPAAGPGLDNGTEPSDLYFECLDGSWNANGNSMYGESDDNVDLFPEVMVGRLPIQTTAEAEKLLASIISIESNPEPGSWINDFMLIAPECFGVGDGVNMVEEIVNQKHLVGSFFDTVRFYPTDGSLSNTAVVDQVNSGVGLIDFFDHGAYNVWVDSMTVAEALALVNGNRTALAFGMACETAAFDVESVEPVMGEALLRAQNGGLHTYIAATRVAWAGYHCFDGFHNRFWDNFLADIFDDRVANPKIAFHAALNEMATIFDVNTGSTRETIYQAIYFGDPTLHMSWKQNVTTETNEVGTNEEVTLTGTCLQFQSGIPLSRPVNVTVRDPVGTIFYEAYPTLDSEGKYSVSFNSNDLAGNYTVETYVWSPFSYRAETEFTVGNPSMTLSLDSAPIHYANLSFSGTTPFDGSGNAYITNLDGHILETVLVTTSSGVYSNQINVTDFGWLRLYVHVNDSSDECGTSMIFKVSRGDILVISDITGGGGPSYPGGWPLYNYGDASNFGEMREALEDEYEVTEWRLMLEGAPSVVDLHNYDAVLVSMGDAYGGPLTCPDSIIIDVLQQYHVEGGNLLFEGGSFLNILESTHSSYFSSLFHVTYGTNVANSGGLYLESGGHPIISGIPSTILLDDDLGSDNVEAFSPLGSSQHVSGYSGSYSGGTAISALSANATNGAVIVIGFAIDAIQNEDCRYQLIENSVGFLLHPTLTVTISDYAMPLGTSDMLVFNTSEASSGTPIVGADISLSGCGVSETSVSDVEGSCSIFVNPLSIGEIIVEVSKSGFLNFSTIITVYDTPIITIETNPIFAEKDITQTITVIATEFYEGVPLEDCNVNLTGCGVSVTGVTNSSGLLDLVIHPTIGGEMLLNVTKAGYVNSTSHVGVPINVLVLPGYGTVYPSDCLWDDLNSEWNDYGNIPVIIDYVSITSSPFTLTDLVNVDADVLVVSYTASGYSLDEVNAIISYVEMGHGLVATSDSIVYSQDVMAPFLGITESLTYSQSSVLSMNIMDPLHSIMDDVTDPYQPGYTSLSYFPSGTGWDGSSLDGAEILALDSSPNDFGAILAYRGMIYFSNIPAIFSNEADRQIFYNALIWTDYVIPEHDLSVSLDAPSYAEPGDTINLNATAKNQGKQDEADVVLRIFIDEFEVDNLIIPLLVNGTEQTLTYIWTPIVEDIYNITAFVDYAVDEYSYGNNRDSIFVNIRPITGQVLWDATHGNDRLSQHSDYETDLDIEGFIIDEYLSGEITSSLLSDYNILVCSEMGSAYTTSELSAIQAFVEGGGGLLVMGDSSTEILSSLTSYAGISFISGSYSGIATDITTHPVTEGVSGVYFGGAVTALTVSGYALSIVRSSAIDLVATSEFGFGYVVAICDDHCLMDGQYNQADNPTFAINIMNWMTAGRSEHELSAMLEVPYRTSPDTEVIVNASVFNRGLNDEVDITLELYIEDTLVDSMYFALLGNGTIRTLSYSWTPSIQMVYNITAAVTNVTDEANIENNVATQMVNVFDLHDYFLIEGIGTWYDAVANGINLGISGDDTYGYVDFPFTFQYYDSDFSTVYISSNGWLSFTNTQPYQYSPPTFPSSDSGHSYCVAPYWADLQAENNIYAWITNEMVVVQYDQYRYLGGSNLGTFQIVFHSSGIIEMNYLIMYDANYGTVGLNHGNGIHYNNYPISFLDGATDVGLRFYYEIPEHEISLAMSVPSIVDFGSSASISSTITNMGLKNETSIHYILYIDEVIVEEEIIAEILIGDSHTNVYTWSPSLEGIYNVTAYVVPVTNETLIMNNRVEREVIVADTTLLTDFETGEGGFHTEGLWHLVDDDDPYGNSHSPTHAMWYGQDDTGDYNTGSTNMGDLISRLFLLGSDAAALTFWSWYQTEDSGHTYDRKDIYVILPETDTWILIGYVSGAMDVWTENSFDISDYANEIVQFAFRFDTVTSAGNFYRGWYIDDISIIGSLTPIEKDLEVSISTPYEGDLGDTLSLYATVVNCGQENEFNVDLRIYIDGALVESIIIGTLGSLENYTLSYQWTPGLAGIYNITAYVVPVSGEILLSNNQETNFVLIRSPKIFTILEPTSGSIIEGSLVYVTYEWTSSVGLQSISIYVNSEIVTSCSYYGNNDLFVPIFQNGTNVIELVIQWTDGDTSSDSVTIQSENVVPIIDPIVGDFADYRLEQPGYLMDYNFTFTGESSPFEWDITLTLAQRNPDTGAIISIVYNYLTANILNGYISNGSLGWTGYALFWVTGVDAPIPMQSYADIGDHGFWFYWSQIYDIVDNGMWNGHPTWVLESSETTFVLEVLMPNGILISLEEASMGMSLNVLNSCFISEPDTTPPEWIVVPSDQIAEIGTEFEYALDASDDRGFLIWELNDTTHFDISKNGVVSNIGIVPVGIYVLEVCIYDAYLNNISAIFAIEVIDTYGPEWSPAPTNRLHEYGYGFSYQLDAYDPSGIVSWEINDTIHFNISPSGLVQNVTSLSIGNITVEVIAWDPYDNNCTVVFWICTDDRQGPIVGEYPTNIVLEYGIDFTLQLDANDMSGIAHWNVSDHSYFSIDSNGLLSSIDMIPVGTIVLEISVSDIYENENTIEIVITVQDTTAPNWITAPSDVTLDYGQDLSVQLSAYDLSGIANWNISDSVHFNIDQTGLLINAIALDSGVYELNITVSDEYGNEQTSTITIMVNQSTTTESTSTSDTSTTDTSTQEPNEFMTMVLIVVISTTFGIVVFVVIIRSPLGKRFGR